MGELFWLALVSLMLQDMVSTSPRTQTRSPVVLFAVSGVHGEVSLDPIGWLRGRRIIPPTDSVTRSGVAFAATYERPGQRYVLLRAGAKVGMVTVISAPDSNSIAGDGCFAMDVTARDSGLQPGIVNQEMLASNKSTWGRLPGRRALTAAESGHLDRIARMTFRTQGESPAAIQGMRATATTGIVPGPDSTLFYIGSYEITDTAYETPSALFLIVRADLGTIALADYKSAADMNDGVKGLIDALDVDDDGAAELILKTTYYESWTYTILKRKGKQWVDWFTGSGGGC